MFPLIDVVFLLLTFFIFNTLITPETRTLPVDLTLAQSGVASADQFFAVTIDASGELYFNQTPTDLARLGQELEAMARMSPVPSLYLAMAEETAGTKDRGTVWVQVIEACFAAGITDLNIVGSPGN